MKVNKHVIEKYTSICKHSTAKCNSYSDVEYKIIRAVRLGKLIETKNEIEIVRYHTLNFYLKKNVVIDMEINNSQPSRFVTEKRKYEYDKIHNKMVV